ncbi:MAG: site-specific DNA-methyltransferase [Chloroflexi bacterium]|nr:site-specific DNA-methyltransferase [Chloroflexota bacterium]
MHTTAKSAIATYEHGSEKQTKAINGRLPLPVPEPNGHEYLRLDTAEDFRIESIAESLLIRGSAEEALDRLPAAAVQTVVTSPPYWSLRDYAVDSQIGRDDSLPEYVASIVRTFEKLRHILTDDGTVWLNVGDSYTSGNRRYRAPDRKNRARAMSVRPPTPTGLKAKELVGVPWRLAFALQAAGWWVRSEVIWAKPNAHPESVRDRPTLDHETVFLLSKNQNYYYNIDAVRGPNDRRLRTTWSIPTDPQRQSFANGVNHPAVMPIELANRCLQITSRPGDVVLDPYAGSGTTLVAARDLDRKWVGIELSSEFTKMIERRLEG